MPFTARLFQCPIRADRALSSRTTHRKLHREDRDAHTQQEQQIEQDEHSASVLYPWLLPVNDVLHNRIRLDAQLFCEVRDGNIHRNEYGSGCGSIWGYAWQSRRDGTRNGDGLAFAKEDGTTGGIQQIVVAEIDGKTLQPGIWYGVELEKRMVN